MSEIIEKVKPKPEAKYVAFSSADSYYESYTIDELLRDRVLMVPMIIVGSRRWVHAPPVSEILAAIDGHQE